MTVVEFELFFEKVQYKKDVKIVALYDIFTHSYLVRLSRIVEDANCGDEKVDIHISGSIKYETISNFIEKDVIDFLWALIQSFELHEAKEWFRVGGKRVFEPHLEEENDSV